MPCCTAMLDILEFPGQASLPDFTINILCLTELVGKESSIRYSTSTRCYNLLTPVGGGFDSNRNGPRWTPKTAI